MFFCGLFDEFSSTIKAGWEIGRFPDGKEERVNGKLGVYLVVLFHHNFRFRTKFEEEFVDGRVASRSLHIARHGRFSDFDSGFCFFSSLGLGRVGECRTSFFLSTTIWMA